jgi:hypothetical protein
MNARKIWILNFGTTLSFLILLSERFYEGMHLKSSDKDIIIVYLLILIGLYLVIISYQFYYKIYKWGPNRRPFYILTGLIVLLSFMVLIQTIAYAEKFESWTIILLLSCGLNVASYLWGLMKVVMKD